MMIKQIIIPTLCNYSRSGMNKNRNFLKANNADCGNRTRDPTLSLPYMLASVSEYKIYITLHLHLEIQSIVNNYNKLLKKWLDGVSGTKWF